MKMLRVAVTGASKPQNLAIGERWEYRLNQDFRDSRICRIAVAVSKRGSETLPISLGAKGKVGKGGRIEGGRKLESISQARKRRGFTVYATGGASMEEDLDSLILLIFYR